MAAEGVSAPPSPTGSPTQVCVPGAGGFGSCSRHSSVAFPRENKLLFFGVVFFSPKLEASCVLASLLFTRNPT